MRTSYTVQYFSHFKLTLNTCHASKVFLFTFQAFGVSHRSTLHHHHLHSHRRYLHPYAVPPPPPPLAPPGTSAADFRTWNQNLAAGDPGEKTNRLFAVLLYGKSIFVQFEICFRRTSAVLCRHLPPPDRDRRRYSLLPVSLFSFQPSAAQLPQPATAAAQQQQQQDHGEQAAVGGERKPAHLHGGGSQVRYHIPYHAQLNRF